MKEKNALGICVPGWTVDSVCSAASPPQGYSAAVAPGPYEAPPSRGYFIASSPLPRATLSRVALFSLRQPSSLDDLSAGCAKSARCRSPRGWRPAWESRDLPAQRCHVPLIVPRAVYQPLHSPSHTCAPIRDPTLPFAPFVFSRSTWRHNGSNNINHYGTPIPEFWFLISKNNYYAIVSWFMTMIKIY